MNIGSALPAYGVGYKSAKEVYAAWIAGKDFALQGIGGGQYVNREDAERMHTSGSINVRYKGMREVCVIAWGPKGVTLNGNQTKEG